jgi:hypothetical protein
LVERVAGLLAELVEAAANNTRLAADLDQERAEASATWSWSPAFTIIGVMVWVFRWGWAVLAAHFPRFPKRDPFDR